MKKMMFKQGLLAGVAIFSIATLPAIAMAQNNRTYDTQQSREESAQTRLEDVKLQGCQNRHKRITNILTRIADRGQKQVDLFSAIAQRTEKFYADKDKILANYEVLVSDVAAKKVAAQTAVDALKADSATFDCRSDNPRETIIKFKENLKIEVEALKAYKASVRSLIVGVKSVQDTASSESRRQQ